MNFWPNSHWDSRRKKHPKEFLKELLYDTPGGIPLNYLEYSRQNSWRNCIGIPEGILTGTTGGIRIATTGTIGEISYKLL